MLNSSYFIFEGDEVFFICTLFFVAVAASEFSTRSRNVGTQPNLGGGKTTQATQSQEQRHQPSQAKHEKASTQTLAIKTTTSSQTVQTSVSLFLFALI